MYVFVRIRYSQALRFVPCLYWWNAANALANVSWTRSSASVGLRVVRSAALYSWSRNGMASFSKRAIRSCDVSVLISSSGSWLGGCRTGSSTWGSPALGWRTPRWAAVDVEDGAPKALWSAVIAFQPNAERAPWLP